MCCRPTSLSSARATLDPGEVAYLAASGVDEDLERALAGTDSVYVAIDVDVLDAAAAASFMPEPGGWSVDRLEATLVDVRERAAVAGAGLTGHVPATESALLLRLLAALGL